ncbi:molybdate ABC transporter substrate-binding protein [Brevibacillus daliensis]|uniref:molybdate ABC transporter substrate-binding protein n=1 Tax=Brevibacillus daliensis TaxID=2892995 RepID=UPI001E3B410C|nr:molybdate ABC transporter substrate-binding protein [Brevibacillus daliensis]
MKKLFALPFLISLLLVAITGCSTTAAPTPSSSGNQEIKAELLISAAASLTDVLEKVKKEFEQEHSDISLTFQFGGSGKLAQQIEQGAPADLFLSASSKDMKRLQDNKHVLPDTITDIASNELVLIAPLDSTISINSFESLSPELVKQFAIGEPSSVPVGRYTEETLSTLGLWENMKQAMVYAKDVRQVLTYVESSNAELGVVYKSDALTSSKVKILATAKQEWYSPINYPAAVVTSSKNQTAAKEFLTFLSTDKAKAIFLEHGFLPVNSH